MFKEISDFAYQRNWEGTVVFYIVGNRCIEFFIRPDFLTSNSC